MLNDIELKLLDKFRNCNLQQKTNIENYVDFAYGVLTRDYDNRQPILDLNKKIKAECMDIVARRDEMDVGEKYRKVQRASDIYWEILLMEARFRQVDRYLLYLER